MGIDLIRIIFHDKPFMVQNNCCRLKSNHKDIESKKLIFLQDL